MRKLQQHQHHQIMGKKQLSNSGIVTLKHREVRDCKLVYVVFHYNNGIVTPETKKQKLLWARAGYEDVKAICDKENIPLVVENVSLTCHQSMLFEEQEFIDECKRIQCPVLIDIGHANISGWNLRRMMEELRDQIVSYHVHNNAGIMLL